MLLLVLCLQDVEVRRIAEAAARGDYEAAELLSLERVKREPPSPLAWFYLGHARAARGRFAEAVEPYQKAVDLGLSDPKARFQLGYAAHKAGRHDLAVPALREVLRARPEHDEARAYLGMSLVETRSFEEALEVLSPLVDRDGPWRLPARQYRDLALRGLDGEAVETPRAWALAFQGLLKAGYDSNVLLLPRTSQARGSEEGAAFVMSFASAEADPWGDGRLVARGSVLDIRYDDLAEADIGAFLFELAGRATLSDVLSGRAALHGDAVRLGHDPLFNRVGPEAGLLWRLDPAWTIEVAARWMSKDFRPDAFQDLDGGESEGRVEAGWTALPGLLELRLAYRLEGEDAAEEAFDVLSHRVEARVSVYPAPEGEARLEAWFAGAKHGAPDPTAQRTRRDQLRGARVSFFWTLCPSARLFVDAEMERNASTIGDFDYSRRAASAGVALAF